MRIKILFRKKKCVYTTDSVLLKIHKRYRYKVLPNYDFDRFYNITASRAFSEGEQFCGFDELV